MSDATNGREPPERAPAISMSSPGPGKKLHHFVPRSYLRAFADLDERLIAILRDPYEVRTVHVNTVAAERYFYKVRTADGQLSDDLEDALAEFDGLVPKILRVAGSSQPLSAGDASALRMLYANLCARGELGRDKLVADVRATRLRIESDFTAKFPDENVAIHESLLDAVIRSVFDHPERYAADADTVSRLNVVRLAAAFEAAMPPGVCVLESTDLEIITSDAPFAWFDPDEPPSSGISGPSTLSSPRLELTLPIGRRHVALFANTELPRRARINGRAAAILNARTAFFARRMVFAHHSSEAAGIAELNVMHCNDFYATPLLDAFEPER